MYMCIYFFTSRNIIFVLFVRLSVILYKKSVITISYKPLVGILWNLQLGAVGDNDELTVRRNCFSDRTITHTSGNSSINTSLIRDIYCGPEVLFETCVAEKFMDDDDYGCIPFDRIQA